MKLMMTPLTKKKKKMIGFLILKKKKKKRKIISILENIILIGNYPTFQKIKKIKLKIKPKI